MNKTIPTILATIAAIAISGSQTALADHDDWGRGHDHDRNHHFQDAQWNSRYHTNNVYRNNNGYYNSGYHNGYYRHHHRTVKHEIRHVLRNL